MTQIPEFEAEEELFTLILTRKEAAVLRTIMRKISGPSAGPRQCTDQINEDLREMNIGYYNYDPQHLHKARNIELPQTWGAMGPEVSSGW